MFEKALVPEPRGGRARRFRSFAAALLGHGAAIGGMLLAGAMVVEAARDPRIADFALTFTAPQPPPLETEPAPPKQREEPPPPERHQPPPRPEPRTPPPPPPVEEPRLRPQVEAPEPADVGNTVTRSERPAAIAAVDHSMLVPNVEAPSVPRAGGSQPSRRAAAGLDAGGGGSSVIAYHGDAPPTMGDMVLPAPGTGSGRGGGRPGSGSGAGGLLPAAGESGTGSASVHYGTDGPSDGTGFGSGTGQGSGRGSGTGTALAATGSAGGLSTRYGLPLVSVNSLGSRSTDAARWNVILPRLADLLRQATNGPLAVRMTGNVLSVEQDGGTLVVRYRDGVVHVLVPTDDGLAALYVARAAGARPVVSKVQEGESALDALIRLTRGAS